MAAPGPRANLPLVPPNMALGIGKTSIVPLRRCETVCYNFASFIPNSGNSTLKRGRENSNGDEADRKDMA